MGKPFGALYLILGTCVAAGLLGLPVVTAQFHIALTLIMLVSAWFVMTVGAWCLLQVTVQMPHGANLISMSKLTLGKTAKMITWCVYLLLLYSLICAYLSASSDLLEHVFLSFHLPIPRFLSTILSALILGSIVIHGIRSVDFVNRGLMTIKILICLLVIVCVIPHTQSTYLSVGQIKWSNSAWLVIICAFGYATILPSIRDYLNNDKKIITRVMMIGSLIPLLLYIVWIIVIQSALPRETLLAMNNSANTNSLLITNLSMLTHHVIIKTAITIFISICSITGFLGVSVGLVDFFSDGLNIPKIGIKKIALGILAFLPPLIIVMLDPGIFIRALSYAGVCCLYILIALPVAMYVTLRLRAERP